MVTQESGLILYLLLSLCSLIVVHRWFPINFSADFLYDGGGDGDGGDWSSQPADQEAVTLRESLNCDHLKEITKVSVIGSGEVKIVYLAKWRQHLITLSQLRDPRYQDDFNHNRLMLQQLSSSGKVVQLLGTCNDTILMTQFHPLGNPLNLLVWNHHLLKPIITQTVDYFKLCLQFVDLIVYLHTHPSGPLVMCDSNSLSKLLSQLLLSIVHHHHHHHHHENVNYTDPLIIPGLQLIVNDLDALPTVQNESGIKCGHRQLFGSFVAPEQLWPYPDKPFNDHLMTTYNEKIDIWKIPDVCSWFIKLSPNGQQLINLLKPLHDQCKQSNPNLRPNASIVFQEYLKVYQQFVNQHQIT